MKGALACCGCCAVGGCPDVRVVGGGVGLGAVLSAEDCVWRGNTVWNGSSGRAAAAAVADPAGVGLLLALPSDGTSDRRAGLAAVDDDGMLSTGSKALRPRPDWKARGWEGVVALAPLVLLLLLLLAVGGGASGVPAVVGEMLLPNVAAGWAARDGCRTPAASSALGRLATGGSCRRRDSSPKVIGSCRRSESSPEVIGPCRCRDSSPEVGATPSATGPAPLVCFMDMGADCARCIASSE